MGQPVVHWEIAGKDRKALQSFYSGLFSWKIDDNNPMEYGSVETGGEGGINGGILKAPHGTPYLTFYVQVDDIQAYLDKAVSLGGEIAVPAMEIPGIGWSGFLKDPDGNVVGLYKPAG